MSADTTAARVKRAVEIGRELGRIERTPQLHSLSRRAWEEGSQALCGSRDLAEAIQLVEAAPELCHEAHVLSKLWGAHGQDRPALAAHVFNDPDRFIAAYVQRVAQKLTVAECSAVASWWSVRDKPMDDFGWLESFEQLAEMVDPLHAELAQLDRLLQSVIRLVDVIWVAGKPALRLAGMTIEVGPETPRRIASAVAEAAQLMAHEAVAEAA